MEITIKSIVAVIENFRSKSLNSYCPAFNFQIKNSPWCLITLVVPFIINTLLLRIQNRDIVPCPYSFINIRIAMKLNKNKFPE